MKYAIHPAETSVITLPRELASALGDSVEAEVIQVAGGLLVRAAAQQSEEDRRTLLDRIAAFRASLAPGAAFSDEEWESLRAASRAKEEQEAVEILGLIPDGDDLSA